MKKMFLLVALCVGLSSQAVFASTSEAQPTTEQEVAKKLVQKLEEAKTKQEAQEAVKEAAAQLRFQDPEVQKKIIIGGAVLAAAVAVGAGAWYWNKKRKAAAAPVAPEAPAEDAPAPVAPEAPAAEAPAPAADAPADSTPATVVDGE